MKRTFAFAILAAASLQAFAMKPCEELKTEIAQKLEAKGVKDYSLDIVATAEAEGKTVVGSCEAGSKKIVYAKK